MVHAESRSLCCNVRNTSATPASPVWVATRIVSTYLDLGAASCCAERRSVSGHIPRIRASSDKLTLSFVAPLTDFSKLVIVFFGEGGCSRGCFKVDERALLEYLLSSEWECTGSNFKKLEELKNPLQEPMPSWWPRRVSIITGVVHAVPHWVMADTWKEGARNW